MLTNNYGSTHYPAPYLVPLNEPLKVLHHLNYCVEHKSIFFIKDNRQHLVNGFFSGVCGWGWGKKLLRKGLKQSMFLKYSDFSTVKLDTLR